MRVQNNDLIKEKTSHFLFFISEWKIAEFAPPKAASRDGAIFLVLRRERWVGQAWGKDWANLFFLFI